NTSLALAAVMNLVRDINTVLDSGEFGNEDRQQVLDLLGTMDSVLGVRGAEEVDLLAPEIEAKIEDRNAARRARNFALADLIRDVLAALEIVLEDAPQGTR